MDRELLIEIGVEEVPASWLPGLTTQLADVLSISRANAYNLLHREDFPTLHIGKRMLVPKDRLIQWIEANVHTEVCA